MPTCTFNIVALSAEKTGKCGCGKQRRRSEKFWQSINPLNCNADGIPKTAEEIREELRRDIKAWRLKPIICDACRDPATT